MNSEETKMHSEEETKAHSKDDMDAEDMGAKPTKDMKEHKIKYSIMGVDLEIDPQATVFPVFKRNNEIGIRFLWTKNRQD